MIRYKKCEGFELGGAELEGVVEDVSPFERVDPDAVKDNVFAAIKNLKTMLGKEFLTSEEMKEEKDE